MPIVGQVVQAPAPIPSPNPIPTNLPEHPRLPRLLHLPKRPTGFLCPTLNPQLSQFYLLQIPNPKSPIPSHSSSLAPMAALQLRTRHRNLQNYSLFHFFSTSATPPDPNTTEQSPSSPSPQPSQSQSNVSSYFSDVKASLKQQQQQRATSPFSPRNPTNAPKPSHPINPSFSKPSKVASLEEIRKNLSEFRLRASVPPSAAPSTSPSFPSSSQHISFQELYKRNVAGKTEENGTNAGSGPGKVGGSAGMLSFEAIRESLRQLRSSSAAPPSERLSLSEYKNSLKLKPSMDSGPVMGGTETLPVSVFGKERERKEAEGDTMAAKTEFVKMYSYEELGEKLRKLRPEAKKTGEGWFSLGELNDRLMKLREMEEEETESRISGVSFRDLRESLLRLRISADEKAKKSSSK